MYPHTYYDTIRYDRRD